VGSAGAAQQASVLFLFAGVIALVSNHLPDANYAVTNDVVGVLALAIVPLGWVLPWSRWSPRLSLAYVPFCLGLLVASSMFGTVEPEIYGVWFVVCFVWIGLHHPPKVPLAFGIPAAITYVVPLIHLHRSPQAVQTVAIAIPAAVLIGEVLARTNAALGEARAAQEQAANLLALAAVTDDLTGLGNRRRANSILDEVVPGDALLLLDLDHFKEVNDRLGHAAGDELLTRFGAFLAQHSDESGDASARYGGEEFLVVVHRDGRRDGGEVAERLLATWRATGAGVTFSVGVAVHEPNCSPWDTLAAADRALYCAKVEGRDRAVLC
jgi:diguanylate cyclase (GGDEF)-like protein